MNTCHRQPSAIVTACTTGYACALRSPALTHATMVKTSSELFLLTTPHFDTSRRATKTVAQMASTSETSNTAGARLVSIGVDAGVDVDVGPSLILHGYVVKAGVLMMMNRSDIRHAIRVTTKGRFPPPLQTQPIAAVAP